MYLLTRFTLFLLKYVRSKRRTLNLLGLSVNEGLLVICLIFNAHSTLYFIPGRNTLHKVTNI